VIASVIKPRDLVRTQPYNQASPDVASAENGIIGHCVRRGEGIRRVTPVMFPRHLVALRSRGAVSWPPCPREMPHFSSQITGLP
jgi:hypothetical protein